MFPVRQAERLPYNHNSERYPPTVTLTGLFH